MNGLHSTPQKLPKGAGLALRAAFVVLVMTASATHPTLAATSRSAASGTSAKDSASRTSPQDTADRKAEVTAAVQKFVSTWNAHDTDAMLRQFTQDGRLTSPRGASAKGREEIRHLLTEEHRDIYKGTELRATIESIQFPQTGTAAATGTFTLQGVDAVLGIEVAPEGTFTFRLVRQVGRWLISRARIFKE